jgi:hypothetical protein
MQVGGNSQKSNCVTLISRQISLPQDLERRRSSAWIAVRSLMYTSTMKLNIDSFDADDSLMS